jgi:hypothetical protein
VLLPAVPAGLCKIFGKIQLPDVVRRLHYHRACKINTVAIFERFDDRVTTSFVVFNIVSSSNNFFDYYGSDNFFYVINHIKFKWSRWSNHDPQTDRFCNDHQTHSVWPSPGT